MSDYSSYAQFELPGRFELPFLPLLPDNYINKSSITSPISEKMKKCQATFYAFMVFFGFLLDSSQSQVCISFIQIYVSYHIHIIHIFELFLQFILQDIKLLISQLSSFVDTFHFQLLFPHHFQLHFNRNQTLNWKCLK